MIERTTRSCCPTANGRDFAERARAILSAYDEAFGVVTDRNAALEGPLRITAPITFGLQYVASLVDQFLDLHPGIDVELQLLDRVVDLVEEDFDIAVRIGALGSGALISRGVGRVARMVVASPAYLERAGVPSVLEDLARHDVILHVRDARHRSGLFEGWPAIIGARRVRLAVNHPDAAIQAARDGRGLTNVLETQVARDLENGALVRVLGKFESPPLPVSILWPQSRRGWRRVRAVADYLVTNLSSLQILRQPTG